MLSKEDLSGVDYLREKDETKEYILRNLRKILSKEDFIVVNYLRENELSNRIHPKR